MTDLTPEETALFKAIDERRIDDSIKIIQAGNVRINCVDGSGMNPLDQACFRGDEDLVRFLIKHGASVDNREHPQGYTCLMFAALAGKPGLCQMLLDAGARAHATNTIGKTASELAAFIGQHECVSVISSHLDSDAIERILHPQGAASEVIYPPELATFIHNLTKTHEVHPVKIVFDVAQHPIVLEHRKKVLFVIDTLFEKQLRSKEPNESQSIKLWFIFCVLRELLKFVDSNVNSDKSAKDIMLFFAKKLLSAEPNDLVRKPTEVFLRSAVRAFPYHNSLLFQTLAKSVAKVDFGQLPTTYTLLLQALFGARYVETSRFCGTCAMSSASKQCPKCKLPYCSAECQKFDWSIHKKCCEAISKRPAVGGDSATYIELNEDSLNNVKIED